MARYANNTVLIQDANGRPITGAYTYFYEPGTTALKTIYSDEDLLISQANPVRSLAGGYLPEIFIDGLYKVVQNDENDVALWPSQDPVGEIVTGQFDAWLSDESYSINEIVLGADAEYYISLVNTNQGNTPSASPSQWQLIPVKDMVGLDDTQTLTNKTLTSPTINTATIAGSTITSPDIDQVVDSNGNEVLIYAEVASAVNEVTVTNAATGNKPSIDQTGEDVGIDIEGVELKNGGIVATGTCSFPAASGATMHLISTSTASASASLEITAGIDATYKAYVFILTDILPATDNVSLNINFSDDAGSTWKASYNFHRRTWSAGSSTATGSADTINADIIAATGIGNLAAESVSGTLILSNPASTVANKKIEGDLSFHGTTGILNGSHINGSYTVGVAAIDGIRFLMSSGNIASGTIDMYGISA